MTAPKRRGGAPEPAESPIEGLVVDPAAASRTGEDTRRRGWFWHWNSIVTQYAPLLGLKGVGLLNSYTVWTDRREESPHRGYAFPSQQSEADFYGEDRAELITINKILVALDLIEIRKEMVLRTDPQGRRWRVPHNFYRVKDHTDGFSLTAREVMTVAQLADRDKAVYRYVRRIFSPRFSPIDGENVWHAILTEVRQSDLWQRLAERTETDERRASARTRAGHAARRAGTVGDEPGGLLFVPNRGDEAATGTTANDSGNVITPEGGEAGETIVAATNRGSMVDVDPANRGLDENPPTIVAPANQGPPTAVAPANTTYHQSLNTTTTTVPDDEETRAAPMKRPARHQLSSGPDAAPPADAPGEEAALRAFAEANNRPATPAERKLLAGLAERFSATAAEAPANAPATGWLWLTAAIYEAVEAGSTFVAPRRLREILSRWEREGYPQSSDDRAPRPDPSPASARPRRGWQPARAADPPVAAVVPDSAEPTSSDGSKRAARRTPAASEDREEPAATPAGFVIAECGLWSEQVWSAVLTELERHPAVGPADFAAWLRSTLLLGRAGDGEPGSPLVVGVPHSLAQRRVASRFQSVIAATLAGVVGAPLPVEIAVVRDWLARHELSPSPEDDAERHPAIGA